MPWLVNTTITKAEAATNGTTYVALKPADNRWHRWFKADPSNADEVLASALAAIDAKAKAQVLLSTTDSYGIIQQVHIQGPTVEPPTIETPTIETPTIETGTINPRSGEPIGA